jgi:hypothetical protein
MLHFKFIFLILSSTNLDPKNSYFASNAKYEKLKQFILTYYALFPTEVQFYFLEARPTQQHLVEWNEAAHLMTVKTEENVIPGMLIKIKTALQAILHGNAMTTEHFICTNLSTVFNFPRLLKEQESWPKTRFYGGNFCADRFVSGTCIVMSPDVAKMFVQIPVHVRQFNDLYMHNYITNQKQVTAVRLWPCPKLHIPSQLSPFPPYRMHNPDCTMNPDIIRQHVSVIRIRSDKPENDVATTQQYLRILYPTTQFA